MVFLLYSDMRADLISSLGSCESALISGNYRDFLDHLKAPVVAAIKVLVGQ